MELKEYDYISYSVYYCRFILLLVVLNSTDIFMNFPSTQVGLSLTLECNITTVGNITSSVDIVWSENNVELTRTEGVNVSYTNNNKAIYVDKYIISQVSTNDDGKVYECKIIIGQGPPLIAIATSILDVNGKCYLANC